MSRKFVLMLLTVAIAVCVRTSLFGEEQLPVDFYGIASADADANMLSMTGDLFFAQLKDIATLAVSDKRKPDFSAQFLASGTSLFSGSDKVFFVLISKIKEENGTWLCSCFLYDPASGKTWKYEKKYDSYYKILMEAKSAIKSVLLLRTAPADESHTVPENDPLVTAAQTVSTDMIAGTWNGEESIDKIVILRGGRGFIIFKNGASMTITVSLDETKKVVIISQNGHANASYYPDIPRKTALELAQSAPPITWKLSLIDEKTLIGVKNTYAIGNDGTAAWSEISVTWQRH